MVTDKTTDEFTALLWSKHSQIFFVFVFVRLKVSGQKQTNQQKRLVILSIFLKRKSLLILSFHLLPLDFMVKSVEPGMSNVRERYRIPGSKEEAGGGGLSAS